jgi:hypothetical protein
LPDRQEALAALQGLSEHDLKLVIGELVLDPRVRRREGMRGWWYRYAGSVAFICLIAVAALGFTVLQNQQTQLVNGLVTGCEQNGNPLRAIVSAQLKTQLDQQQQLLESGQYAKFFPGIPKDQLNHLINQQQDTAQAEIKQLKPVDCDALYR